LELTLKGPTLKAAISGLQINMAFKDFIQGGFQRALYYTVRLKIISPEGNITYIPVSGSDIPDGFANKGIINIANKRLPAVSQELDRIANLLGKISYSLRRAIKDQGLRFTTLTTLKSIERREIKRIQKLTDPNAITRAESGIEKLWVINRTPVESLRQITRNWQVILYIKFELY
jgi:hypothetical protein